MDCAYMYFYNVLELVSESHARELTDLIFFLFYTPGCFFNALEFSCSFRAFFTLAYTFDRSQR